MSLPRCVGEDKAERCATFRFAECAILEMQEAGELYRGFYRDSM